MPCHCMMLQTVVSMYTWSDKNSKVRAVQYISHALKGIHSLYALVTREYNQFEALTKTPQTFVAALLKW